MMNINMDLTSVGRSVEVADHNNSSFTPGWRKFGEEKTCQQDNQYLSVGWYSI